MAVSSTLEPSTTNAVAEVYEAYSERVYHFMLYHVRHPATAEDLTAEVFERVLARWHTYNAAKGDVEVWLFRIARNHMVDHARRAKRQGAALPLEATHRDPAPTPPQQAEANEQMAALKAAIAALPRRQQAVFSLRYAAGLSTAQIGAVTGLSQSNVTTTLHRARKTVEAQLEGADLNG